MWTRSLFIGEERERERVKWEREQFRCYDLPTVTATDRVQWMGRTSLFIRLQK